MGVGAEMGSGYCRLQNLLTSTVLPVTTTAEGVCRNLHAKGYIPKASQIWHSYGRLRFRVRQQVYLLNDRDAGMTAYNLGIRKHT